MHVKSRDGKRFISEEEYNTIQLELSFGRTKEELDHEREQDNAYHNYILGHKTPEQIISNKLNSRTEKLNAMFSGTELQAYEPNEKMTEEALLKFVKELNAHASGAKYEPFLNTEGKMFILEKMVGQPANIQEISKFLLKHVQTVHIEVN